MDEQQMQELVAAICTADPQLGAEWYELLGKEAASADSSGWTELEQRIQAAATDAGVPADGLLEYLGETDPAVTQSLIAAYVWPAETAGADGSDNPASGEAAAEDLDAWNAFLQQNGPAWDGAQENWQAFVTWFVYTADEQNVGRYARQFCDYAASNDPVAVFAEYGISLPSAFSDQEQNDLLLVQSNTMDPGGPAPGNSGVEGAIAAHSASVLADFRRDFPHFDDTVSDEKAIALMAEIVREHLDPAASA